MVRSVALKHSLSQESKQEKDILMRGGKLISKNSFNETCNIRISYLFLDEETLRAAAQLSFVLSTSVAVESSLMFRSKIS